MMKEFKNLPHFKHKTFGLPTLSVSPKKFLKKDDGIRYHYERTKICSSKCNLRKPSVPKHNEISKIHFSTNENVDFKLINITKAKTAQARTIPVAQNFEQKPPVYIHTSKFGTVPEYLQNLKRIKINQIKEKEERVRNEENQNQVRVIDDEEKKKLLDGLKHNWQKLQEEYQKMPLLIDSVPKMIRKTKLENNLKSLEQDICLLNTNKNRIFILPD